MTRRADHRFLTAAQGRLAVVLLAFGLVPAAGADDAAGAAPGRTWQQDFNTAASRLFAAPPGAQSLVTSAVVPESEDEFDRTASAAPAHELAARLDVRVQQKRRKFRSEAVSWMEERSVAMGTMTDLLLGGSDSGWHVVVDPSGADEYILEWKVRFR